MSVQILTGDVRAMLATLPDASVQCVVTSPPYFGLRAYGTNPQVWGDDPEHAHEWGAEGKSGQRLRNGLGDSSALRPSGVSGTLHPSTGTFCPCGAWRGELGSEPTPSLFIEHLVSIFDEVRRVMRPDGVCFVNLGDSYSSQGGRGEARMAELGKPSVGAKTVALARGDSPGTKGGGIPAKNLLLIPERFAIAMQDRGWIVRSRIAWCKTSAMPESVRDRPSSAWEHIYMFTREARYFWDSTAARQPALQPEGVPKLTGSQAKTTAGGFTTNGTGLSTLGTNQGPSTANLRNFWLLGPEPSREQHYASFVSEIPRRCILAATSEKGQCPACGAPWVRVVERSSSLVRDKAANAATRGINGLTSRSVTPMNAERVALTIGWQAGCHHCTICDKLGLSADQGRIAHAAQRPGAREGMAPGVEQETVGLESRAPRKEPSAPTEIPEELRAVQRGVSGEVGNDALLQPNLLGQSHVGERASESATPTGDRQVQGHSLSRSSESGTPPGYGEPSRPDATYNRVGASHQRRQVGQQDRESGCLDTEGTHADTREATAHELTPYPPTPQLVLDPFLGSGTTALVADQLGRNAVGIELNPEYARMAERRITNDGPMFADVTVVA